MITISVRSDFARFAAMVGDIERRQVPFAAALALNETAKAAQRQVAYSLPSIFDRPTLFTRTAVGIIPARKDSLAATVFLKDRQARYLAPSILGLRQVAAKRAVLNPKPANVALDALGNLPSGAIRRLRRQRSVFVGRIKAKDGRMIAGVFQRLPGKGAGGQRLKVLVAFGQGVVLRRRFDFDGMVREAAARNFPRAIEAAMTRALETARR